MREWNKKMVINEVVPKNVVYLWLSKYYRNEILDLKGEIT